MRSGIRASKIQFTEPFITSGTPCLGLKDVSAVAQFEGPSADIQKMAL